MRRYELDWLRVIVFGLLIFYHVGMFFVPWEWHIKNNRLVHWLEYPMLFINQWRLPILFVISGMGTSYALANRSAGQFASERITRLLLPLAVGIIFVVPPQVYFERLSTNAFSGDFWNFWPSEAFRGIYPAGNFSWHHLWFLPYLLTFSLLLIPLFLYLRNNTNTLFLNWVRKQLSTPSGFLWFLLPLYLATISLKPYFPETHALVGDWYTLTYYILLFFYGFILISVKDVFWKTVHEKRSIFLMAGILSFSIWILLLHYSSGLLFLPGFFQVLNTWSWILALFGYAAEYLNKKNRHLEYANQAVYPFYILHQTITVTIGFYLMNLPWSIPVKFLILVTGTFGGSWFIYEFLIKRHKFLRPLFGLKYLPPEASSSKAVIITTKNV